MTSEKPKRKPAGAAVPGAVDRPVNYNRTTSFMTDDDTFDAIEATAKAHGVGKADVMREWIALGRKRSKKYPDATAPAMF